MSTASTRARGKALAQASAIAPEPVPMSRTRRTRRASIQGANRLQHEFGNRRARHQHALIDIQLEAGKKRAMREIGQRHALRDAPLQQLHRCAPPGAAASSRRRRLAPQGVREPGDKEHQFSRFVARDCRCRDRNGHRARAQRPRAAHNRRADASRELELCGIIVGMAVRSKLLSLRFCAFVAAGGIAAAIIWWPQPAGRAGERYHTRTRPGAGGF